MFYKFDENGQLENSSNVEIDQSYIEINFTDEQIEKLNKKYDYVDGKFIKGSNAIQFETEQIEKRKQEIILELGTLKTQKDGLILLMEDTTQIDAQIKTLQDEYKTLII